MASYVATLTMFPKTLLSSTGVLMKSGKKLTLNRETVRALSVQEMQNVAGGMGSSSSSIHYTAISQHCGNGGGNGTRTGTGQGNAGTKYCAVK
jgi:natural product precursor